jgi:small GTP-binding protein
MSNRSLKVIILGSLNTGKTSFIKNFLYDKFNEYEESTIGVNINFKKYTINDQNYDICFIDPSGSTRFQFLNNIYIKNINLVFYIFDLSNKQSFRDVFFYIKNFNELNNIKSFPFLIGTKSDKENIVTTEEINTLCKENNIKYFDICNKNTSNKIIEDAFYKTLTKINENYNEYTKFKDVPEFNKKREYCCDILKFL